MEILPKDILIKIALYFDLSDIINLCLTSKIINERVGLNQMFWMKKLSNDYNIFNKDIPKIYILNNGRYDYKKYYLYIDYIDYMLKKYPKCNDLLYFASKKGNLDLLKMSLEKGANIHSNDDRALRIASSNGHLKVVIILVNEGANIHADDDEALIWASRYGYLEVVKFLIESGANIHADKDKALKWSKQEGHLEVVKYLIESGANIHVNNDYAMRWAKENNRNDIIKYLSEQ